MPSISDMKQLELSYFAGENEASTTILEKILEVAYTVKHALAIWPSNPTPRYSHKEKENMGLCKYVYKSAHTTFT